MPKKFDMSAVCAVSGHPQGLGIASRMVDAAQETQNFLQVRAEQMQLSDPEGAVVLAAEANKLAVLTGQHLNGDLQFVPGLADQGEARVPAGARELFSQLTVALEFDVERFGDRMEPRHIKTRQVICAAANDMVAAWRALDRADVHAEAFEPELPGPAG